MEARPKTRSNSSKVRSSLKAFFTPSTETLHHTFNPRLLSYVNNNVFVTRDNEITL